jgi:hypothetical protein
VRLAHNVGALLRIARSSLDSVGPDGSVHVCADRHLRDVRPRGAHAKRRRYAPRSQALPALGPQPVPGRGWCELTIDLTELSIPLAR